MGYVKERFKETMHVEGEWRTGSYRYKAPKQHFDAVVEDYRQKRMRGTLCTGCGRIFVPPKFICGRCFKRATQKVEISQTGTLLAYLIFPPAQKGKTRVAGKDPVEAGEIKEGERLISGFIRFDGTSSVLNLEVLNVDPKNLRPGMRVRAVWAEKPEGRLGDLLGVEPVSEKPL